jgi:hypothetical protein
MNRKPLACLIATVLFVGVSFAQSVAPRMLPLPGIRLGTHGEGAEGLVWQSWTEKERLGFANGFLQGYSTGWREGCNRASEIARERPRLDLECTQSRGDLVMRKELLSGLATKFYSKYPQDRALPINRLFLELLRPNASIESIHSWVDSLVGDETKH